MKTLVILIALMLSLCGRVFAQDGSIDALLRQVGQEKCVWFNLVPTSDFDGDEGLDGKVNLTKVVFTPGKETTGQKVYGMVEAEGLTPFNLKQTLQWMNSSINSPVKFIQPGMNVLCLGSHAHGPDGSHIYPVMVWNNGKWFIHMMDDNGIRNVGETVIMVMKNN